MNDPNSEETKTLATKTGPVWYDTKKTLISLFVVVAATVALLVLIRFTLFR